MNKILKISSIIAGVVASFYPLAASAEKYSDASAAGGALAGLISDATAGLTSTWPAATPAAGDPAPVSGAAVSPVAGATGGVMLCPVETSDGAALGSGGLGRIKAATAMATKNKTKIFKK